MNYYEHHLGDYLRDTVHLTMLEDGAYHRLLGAYYSREKPLPASLAECCKLARAVTKPERDAVKLVLAEFFTLADDGYHQDRTDKEIARFQAKSEKAKANSKLGVEARRRSTERLPNGQPPDQPNGYANGAPNGHPNGLPLQTPIPSHQTPIPTHPPIQAPDRARTLREKYPDLVPEKIPEKPGEKGSVCGDFKQLGAGALSPEIAAILTRKVHAGE